MGNFLKFAELVAMAGWLGSIVFFSFIVAPTLFRTLGQAEAGNAVRALFPKYYLLGLFCSAILALVTATRGFLWGWTGTVAPSLALIGMLAALTAYSRQGITPQLNAAREAGMAGKSRFKALHRRSVLVNGTTLLVLLAYAYWMAMRGY